MTSVVLPTLQVALSWVLFALVLSGCGFLVRLGLARALAPQGGLRPQVADVWVGLAAVTMYLLVWNDVAPVGWYASLLPLGAAIAGLAIGVPRVTRVRPSPVIVSLVAIATVLLANQALAIAADYDFGLYHLGVIHYAEHYSAVPGLANLQTRFGAGDGHLLLVALLDHGPWAGAGPHLADGLLAALLVVELASRFANGRRDLASFTNRMALLLLPVLAIVVVWRPDQRIASPNLDFAAFVLVAVGMLYLAEAVERGFETTAVVTSAATLAAASATRPLYWLVTLAAIAVAVAAHRHASPLRTALLAGAIPAVTAAAWTVRQSILSGYPLFPTTTFTLPVDWRVPLNVVSAQNDWDHAWARWPGNQPDLVLGSWHWLRAFWLEHMSENPDVTLPLLLLACLVPALLLSRGRDSGRSSRTRPMLAVVLPSLATLAGWFFVAPDPRFAWAPIWLVPVALTAWALPDGERRPSPWVAAAACATIPPLVLVGTLSGGFSGWVIPATIGAAAVVAIVAVVLRLGPRARSLGTVVTVTVLVAGLVAVMDIRGVHLRRATHGGPLGMPPDPRPQLVDVTTASGLVVRKPAAGADQCWQAVLCVPQLKVGALALRGSTIGDGFRPTPRRVLTSGGAG